MTAKALTFAVLLHKNECFKNYGACAKSEHATFHFPFHINAWYRFEIDVKVSELIY
jgi:hypothetical protein